MQTNKRVSALVLAGGLGTRLRPLTETTPKCLVPVNGAPLLEYWMQELSRSKVQRAVVNTHHLPEPVRDYLADVNGRLPLHVDEFFEPTLLGSAGTVTANAELAENADAVLLIYADNLSDIAIDELLGFHFEHGAPMTMVLFHTQHPKACGIATMNADETIVEFVEKPAEPKGNLANAGIYVVTPEAYREMVAARGFDLGFDVLPKFVGRMKGFVHGGLHLDIGTLAALEQAEPLARNVFGSPPFGGGQ